MKLMHEMEGREREYLEGFHNKQHYAWSKSQMLKKKMQKGERGALGKEKRVMIPS